MQTPAHFRLLVPLVLSVAACVGSEPTTDSTPATAGAAGASGGSAGASGTAGKGGSQSGGTGGTTAGAAGVAGAGGQVTGGSAGQTTGGAAGQTGGTGGQTTGGAGGQTGGGAGQTTGGTGGQAGAGSSGASGSAGAAGGPVCTPGAKDCFSNKPGTCNGAGQWDLGLECVSPTATCVAGQCKACSTGEKRCTGGVPETCVDGAWSPGAACGAGKVCSNGTCAGTRVSGDISVGAVPGGATYKLREGGITEMKATCGTSLCVKGGFRR